MKFIETYLLILFLILFMCCSSSQVKSEISEKTLRALIETKCQYSVDQLSNHFGIKLIKAEQSLADLLRSKEKLMGIDDVAIYEYKNENDTLFLIYFKGKDKAFYQFDIIESVDENQSNEWVVPGKKE